MPDCSFVVELEYTPWATASPELRGAVRGIFHSAGVVVTREGAPPGAGPEVELPSGSVWSRTSLAVRLVVSGERTPDLEHRILCDACPLLATPLSAVRRQFPSLPFGIQLVLPQYRIRYPFRRDDPPEEIETGTRALTQEPNRGQSGVWGWDCSIHGWVSI
jgi:hypothetical protein